MIELSDEARALIRRVGTADGPSPVDRARVKRRIVATLAGAGAALGSGGTIASGASAGVLAAASVSKVTVTSVALWLLIGAGLGTAVSAPALVSAYRRPEPPPRAAPAAPVAVVPVRPASEPRSPAPAAVAASPTAVVVEERAAADRPRSAPSSGASSLAEETRLLEAAQRELARKNTSAALALLDEHASRFPGGALAEERSAARVLALCDLGRSAEARRAAEAFVRASPRSPLVPRLLGSCARVEPGTDGSRP